MKAYYETHLVDGIIVHRNTRVYINPEFVPEHDGDGFCLATIYLKSPQNRSHEVLPWGPHADATAVLATFSGVLGFCRVLPARMQPLIPENAYVNVGFVFPTYYDPGDRWDVDRVVNKLLTANHHSWWTSPVGLEPIVIGWGTLLTGMERLEEVLIGHLTERRGYREVGGIHYGVRRRNSPLIVRKRYIGKADRVVDLQALDPGVSLRWANMIIDLDLRGRLARKDVTV